MLAEFSADPVRNLFGLSGPWLEVAGATVLAVGIVGYAIRLICYSLSPVRPLDKSVGSSDSADPPDSTYTGPYCAG